MTVGDEVAARGRGPELLRTALDIRPRLVACAERVLGERAEAEDVAQEVLLEMARSGGPDDPGALRAWLLACTWRRALDRVRKRRRREQLARGVAREVAVPEDDAAARGDEAARATRALDALREPYRSAVRLRYLDGLDFAEVARRLGSLERTTRTWVGRGLTQLREALGVEGER